MPVILITLEMMQPLLATSFQGDPNSDVSYDYLPGSMLRGAIIGRYLKLKQQQELDLNDVEVQRLFFDSEKTRYLNAYLLSNQGYRTLPTPRSWHKDKNSELSENSPILVYEFSITNNENEDDEETPKIDSPKSLGGQFCTYEEYDVRLYKPDRRINIHNSRDRCKGRSSKKEGQPSSEGEIFRYDALDAGQTFQSVILCQEQDIPLFEELLVEPNLWVGGSRSAGYGHTKLSYEIKSDDDWQETQAFEEEEDEAEHLTVILLSDTILLDANGQPTANPYLLNVAINNACGSSLPPPEFKNIFSSSTNIGGFNRKWGLPLPQVPALAAGTVVVFENAELTDDQIQQLQWQGIGDRRNEGFGRVAVNWHRTSKFDAKKPSKSRMQQPSISTESMPLAQKIARQILRQKLEQLLKAEVERRKVEDMNISNSQLSRVSILARRGLNSEPVTLQPIGELLERDNLTKIAWDQLHQTRFRGTHQTFYDWLEIHSKPETCFNWIVPSPEVELSSQVKATVDESLAIEYTLRLIMAVAKQATKENQQ